MSAHRRLPVVGIGEDGWAGLASRARDLLSEATLVIGADRQLALLPPEIVLAEREAWPSPMMPRVRELAAALEDGGPGLDGMVLVASGDPMLHGLGSTLARLVDPALLEIVPVPSAYSLACARLGWAQHEVPLISLVADPAADPLPALARAEGRAIVYVPGASGARALAARLRSAGLGAARITILERLGGDSEGVIEATASAFDEDADPLHLVAVDLRPAGENAVRAAFAGDPGAGGTPDHATLPDAERRLRSTVPGLPDDAYGGDGQLTRAEVRAVALAALAPAAGEVLWDVGAGSGTIAIEWCRAAPRTRAIAIEQRSDRCATIAANAQALGAPGVEVVEGAVPEVLGRELPAPDAVFVGGATSHPGLIEQAWDALRPGGRLVASAVTFESERALFDAHARLGGRLVRLEHAQAQALGSFQAWKPERPIVQWSITKDAPNA